MIVSSVALAVTLACGDDDLSRWEFPGSSVQEPVSIPRNSANGRNA